MTLRFLDGQLNEAEVQAFADALRADQRLVDRFTEICLQEQLVADMGAAGLYEEDTDADVSMSVMIDIIQSERDARLKKEAIAAAAPPLPLTESGAPRPWQVKEDPYISRTIVIPKLLVYGSIAAVLLIAMSMFLISRPDRGGRLAAPTVEAPPSQAVDAAPVAELRRIRGAIWAGPGGAATTVLPGPLTVGAQLKLLEGLAEVEMADGALVYLQGPVTVRVDGPGRIQLEQGRLTAQVNDQAVGFEVQTPQALIVDHGTEFGVLVTEDGAERAEVFLGHISLRPVVAGRHKEGVALRSGQGLAISSAGTTRNILSQASSYVRDSEFEALVRADAGSAYYRWVAYRYQLRRDPSVVAYYVFDEADIARNRLTNYAVGAEVAEDGFLGDGGNISPPIWNEGRFEQTRSLVFGVDPHGDCRGVVVPDSDALDFEREMTIAAWVRFNKTTPDWNTLLSKREIPPARLNYQLSLSGQWHEGHCRFQFGAGVDNTEVAGFDEPPSLEREVATGWQHIAVTGDGNMLRYYINGECVLESNQPMLPQVNDAPLYIGTAPPGMPANLQGGPRPFNGAISELLLADRAMTNQELLDLYRAGRPPE